MSAPDKISAKDILDTCKAQGLLAKQLYVVFTTPVNGLGPVMANLEEHLAFQASLEKDGTMFAAGPHWTDDEQNWTGDGMVVLRAGSLAQAKAIAERDPMHARGARKFTIRPWLINEGTLSVRLDFASGKFSLT